MEINLLLFLTLNLFVTFTCCKNIFDNPQTFKKNQFAKFQFDSSNAIVSQKGELAPLININSGSENNNGIQKRTGLIRNMMYGGYGGSFGGPPGPYGPTFFDKLMRIFQKFWYHPERYFQYQFYDPPWFRGPPRYKGKGKKGKYPPFFEAFTFLRNGRSDKRDLIRKAREIPIIGDFRRIAKNLMRQFLPSYFYDEIMDREFLIDNLFERVKNYFNL